MLHSPTFVFSFFFLTLTITLPSFPNFSSIFLTICNLSYVLSCIFVHSLLWFATLTILQIKVGISKIDSVWQSSIWVWRPSLQSYDILFNEIENVEHISAESQSILSCKWVSKCYSWEFMKAGQTFMKSVKLMLCPPLDCLQRPDL